LDYEELDKLHENFKECNITHRDDTSEMQKYYRDWEYKPIRW